MRPPGTARNASVPAERMEAVRKLASELHCPLLCAEDPGEGTNLLNQMCALPLALPRRVAHSKDKAGIIRCFSYGRHLLS